MVNRTIANNLNQGMVPLNISGNSVIKTPRFYVVDRPPTTSDKGPQYIIGTFWVVLNRELEEPYQMWYLADNQLGQPGNTPNATWIRFANDADVAKQITTIPSGRIAIPNAGNWNFQGIDGITVDAPVSGQELVTFTLDSDVAQSFPTDAGTGIPALGVLNIFGSVGGAGHTGDNINTSASGNTVVVHLNKSIHQPDTNSSGTEGVYYLGATGSPLAGGETAFHAYGSGNIFAGKSAGNLTLTVVSAENNSAFGEDSLRSITTGSENFAGGKSALESLTTGSDNVAIGAGSLGNSVAVSNNIGIGTGVAIALSGNDNVIAGHLAATNATSAADSVIIGSGAVGTGILTGAGNVIIGKNAAAAATGMNYTIAIGQAALTSRAGNTGGAIAIGKEALTVAVNNTRQNGSVAIGLQALHEESDVSGGNVAIGINAFVNLDNSGADANCTAVGGQAGEGWETGVRNTFLGGRAGGIIDGFSSGIGNGDDNTAVGAFAMGNETVAVDVTAERNSILGAFGGQNLSTGTDNIFLGYFAGQAETTVSNKLQIGVATGTGDGELNQAFICGIRGITTANNNAIAVLVDSANQLGTVSSSVRFKENIEDMGPDSEIIYKLRPVTFNYKQYSVEDRSPGLIAEEVESVAPWMVAYDEYKEPMSVKYHELPVLLLNELKKLKAEVEELKSRQCCKGLV